MTGKSMLMLRLQNSRSFHFPILVCALLSLSACADGTLFDSGDKSTVLERDGLDVILDDAGKQAFVFKHVQGIEKFCRSPSPDFALTASEGVSLSVGSSQEGVGEDASKGALALGGRNPEVLVARELMYRACELALNINADPQTTRNIYTEFLAAIERIAKSQTGQGVAPLDGTPANARLNYLDSSKSAPSPNNTSDQSGDGQSQSNSGSSSGGIVYSD